MADLAVLGIGLDSKPLVDGVAALDKLASSAKKTEAATQGLGKGVEQAGQRLGYTSKAAEAAERQWSKMAKAADGMSPSMRRAVEAMEKADRAAAAANDNSGRLARGLNHLGDKAAGAAAKMTLLDRAAAGISAGMGVAAAAMGAVGLSAVAAGAGIASVIGTASEFQKLGASLKTVTGSAENADRAFTFIKQFAAETPFTLQEVTQSFIRLQALGLDPSRKALEAYGNVASAMGTPMLQFAEAVADALTGEYERLKEYGITASKEGDRVSMTFQGVTKTIGANAKEMQDYLQGIGRVQFAGAMKEQMSILPGIFGNATDAVDTFKNAIGEGGLSSAIGVVVSKFSEMLNSNKALATSIGAVLGGGIDLYTAAVSTLGEGFVQASRWIQATGQVISETVSGFTAGREAVTSFGTSMTSVASGIVSAAGAIATGWQASGEAIYATINGIIGAGVGAYQSIVATWNQLPAAFGALAKGAGNALVTGLEVAVNGAVTGVNKIIAGINSIAPEFAQVPELPAVDLSDYKASLTEAQAATGATIASIMSAAQSTDYLGAGLKAVGGPISTAAERIAAAKKQIDDAAAASQTLGTVVKETGEGFQIAGAGAASTASDIENGVTKPSKEAAKALREAEAAKNALFSEADAAVERFFPVHAAEQEAARLQAIIDDTGNGLSDLQRRALGMQINQGFIDAMEPAKGLRNGIRDIGDEFDRVGQIGMDAFGGIFEALTSGGDILDNVMDSLATVGGPIARTDKLFTENAA